MTVKHHITPSVLAAYAAGTLPEPFALVVASHVSLCDACRADVAGYEAVGGAVLETVFDRIEDGGDAITMSPDALAQVMAKLDDMVLDTDPAPRASDPVFPAPLLDYVGGGVDAVKWKRIGGGVKQAVLQNSAEGSVRLLYIPAGMAVPDHTHGGLELTMVLQGAFSDETGRFLRGDVETGDEDLEHTPIAEAGMPCICLAATDAPLKFTSLIPRLIQPFIGI
ncbi:Anti-sigma-E factor ChrR [Aquimixticola soesokkakensis]|uniref:Anti-sigma-E factor ChrR n=1 Tax=Aquimixticola soesokkakensis TaxID=1519096 RepID=A0A1Y5RI53_9RHOB|nr:ChrR family anti-sigma-E factor [Aquimixticola soesokkakensis]SLN15408.1 Anti-sigma-E factor ChrR [Aquimixticola soesokkakensis]